MTKREAIWVAWGLGLGAAACFVAIFGFGLRTHAGDASCSRHAPRRWSGVFGRQDCADREAECSINEPKRPRDPNQQYPRAPSPSGNLARSKKLAMSAFGT